MARQLVSTHRRASALLVAWRPWWLGPSIVIIEAIVAAVVLMNRFSPTDAYVYWLGGERLNAGHQLYSLLPGDTMVAANPPYWMVPLLSPPLLGVLWRPLAALGYAGMLIGWMLTTLAFLAALGLVARRTPALTLLVVGTLALPVAWQLMLGNVNGILALAIVLLWLWRDRPRLAGSLVAFIVAVKVTPVVLAWWLVTTRRWRATAWFMGISIAFLVVAALGAGAGSIPAYLDVMLHTSTVGTSDLSVAGLLRGLGVPSGIATYAPWTVAAVGLTAVCVFRAHVRLTFAISVLIIVFGSPVVQLYWYAVPIAALIAVPSVSSDLQRIGTHTQGRDDRSPDEPASGEIITEGTEELRPTPQ